jgi:hypothetical protein
MADHIQAEDPLPKYTSCEHIIIQIAKREGYPDRRIHEISKEVYEERNAQSDINSWTKDEKSS